MRLNKLICFIMILLILFSSFLVNVATADDTIDNLVVAEFYVYFVTGSSLDLEVIMDAQKLTTDKTYYSQDIKNASERDLGAFELLLYQMLDRQFDETFKNADVLNFSMPVFDGNKFSEKLNINLTSSFFGLNESVNSNDFINGVLDIGAIVNYSLNLQAEPGWNNTYFIELGQNLNYKLTTGTIDGNYIKWTVKNWNGNSPSKFAELQLRKYVPTTPSLKSEDIFLEFMLDSKNAVSTSFITNILIKSADIKIYNILPSFVYNLDFVPADGIRLLVDNGFITWDEIYEKTVEPLKEIITTTIEKSSFNQTLDIMFSWDYNTTTDCLVPYEISKMNNKPSVKAILTDDKIDLKICGISSRAIFGLINSGAELNIVKEDVNFGDKLNSIGYNYNITLYLPDKIYLNNKNFFNWKENINYLVKFKSDIATSYSDEDRDTVIVIEVKSTDLNLLSFFTGRTELNFGLDLKETKNYNVTKLPDEFILPEKIILKYLNSDAFRLCVEEYVFSEDRITNFLNHGKDSFENTLRQILPNLEIGASVDRDVFDKSLAEWDGNIANMDANPPIKVGSYAYSSYPVSFDFYYFPPGFDIPTKTFNFIGLPNQNVTYKMIFPNGISIDVADQLNKTVVGKTDDDRYYFEITFSASEFNLSTVVSCKMIPSALFIIGVLLPCIASVIITIILIIVILIIRKKRKIKKPKKISKDEDITSYEEDDFYVPPPPGSK
jgi:hypothetical protein